MRAGVLIVAGIALTLAVIGGLIGFEPGWVIAGEAAIAIVLIVFERARYRPKLTTTTGFRATDERFIDPSTGRKTRVYFNEATGERDYRSE